MRSESKVVARQVLAILGQDFIFLFSSVEAFFTIMRDTLVPSSPAINAFAWATVRASVDGRGAPVPDALDHIAVAHLSGCLCHDKSYHCTIQHRVTKRYVRVIRGNYTERYERIIRPGLHVRTVRCKHNAVVMHFCHTSIATAGGRCLRVCASLRTPCILCLRPDPFSLPTAHPLRLCRL